MNANKFAQSHAKKFNRSENNPLSFFGGGLLFLNTLYITKFRMFQATDSVQSAKYLQLFSSWGNTKWHGGGPQKGSLLCEVKYRISQNKAVKCRGVQKTENRFRLGFEKQTIQKVYIHSDGFMTETMCNPQFKLKSDKNNFTCIQCGDKVRFKTLPKQSWVCTVHST